MNRLKLVQLRQTAHDYSIELRTAHRAGRTIMSTESASTVLKLIERIVAATLEEET